MENNKAKIQSILEQQPDLELAVLVGSRATGTTHPKSDWDIALQWKRELDLFDNLGNTETLRRELAKSIGVEEALIDLINIPTAGLAMRALIAEEGVVLYGEDAIEWNHFLSRTWRELEKFDWDKKHAS